jgi:uncharacterized lipoprotein YddW (UPF0748 family)
MNERKFCQAFPHPRIRDKSGWGTGPFWLSGNQKVLCNRENTGGQFVSVTVLLVVIFLLVACSSQLMANNLPAPESRGVWVTSNYLQGGATAIENLVESVSAANLNIIYICVWHHGSTIYPSNVVSGAGGPLQNPDFTGTDPLRTLLDIAHKHSVEVFAWFEWGFWVGNSSYDSTDTPGIINLHPDWAMVQRDTTKLFFRNIYGYNWWVDPAVPSAANFIVNLHKECAERYPDIDGIETDRIRYPDNTLSYSDTSRVRFMEETGNADPLTLPDDDSAWESWRSLQVTNVVKKIYQSVKEANPKCIVTGAVWPPYGMQSVLQRWDVWAREGYVDLLEPMLYLPTTDFPSQMQLCNTLIPNGFKLYAGIGVGVYGAGSIANVITEIRDARKAHASGEVLFYYGSLGQYSLNSLKDSVYQSPTLSSHNDLLIDNWMPGVFSKEGSWTLMNGGYGAVHQPRGGYGPTYYMAFASSANRAMYAFRILRSGHYSLYGFWSGDSSSNCRSVFVDVVSGSFSKIDTIDQSKNLNTWNFVDGFSFNTGDTVRVTVRGSGIGNVIADAFRLRRGFELEIEDYAVPDSDQILLKFNQNLLSPLPSCTKVYFPDSSTVASVFLNDYDNSVLHVIVPPMEANKPYTLRAVGLVSADYDTLDLTIYVVYDSDSTVVVVDDATPSKFTTMSYPWVSLNDTDAVGGSCRIIKQSTKVVRAQWGPFQVYQDGYYDVYASVPQIPYAISSRCLYLVLNHNGSDSVVTSQQLAVNGWLRLGNFEYKADQVGAVMLSSMPGADTNRYLVADAIMLKRSVNISEVAGKSVIPQDFQLEQNYPNPFNPTTTIEFRIPSSDLVSLKVYDVLGREVATLVDRELAPGSYQIQFDGSNLPSGVYIVRLIAGSYSESRKMLLIK